MSLLLCLSGLMPRSASAQVPADSLRAVLTIALEKPGLASVDPAGVLYVADARQNIVQFAPTGQRLLMYSPTTRGHLATLDATATGKLLAFYDDRQELTLFDRFLAPLTTLQLAAYPTTADVLARAATLAPDGTIWLFDERALALVHLDPRAPADAMRVPLDLILRGVTPPDIRALRVYQNKLYLLDRASGLYVFDAFGAFSRKISLTELADVDFANDTFFRLTPDGRALRYEALYDPATLPRAVALPPAPTGTTWTRAVAGAGRRVYLLGAHGLLAVE